MQSGNGGWIPRRAALAAGFVAGSLGRWLSDLWQWVSEFNRHSGAASNVCGGHMRRDRIREAQQSEAVEEVNTA